MSNRQLLDSLNSLPQAAAQSLPAPGIRVPADFPGRLRIFAALAAVLVAGFAAPLWSLVRYAAHSDLYSHILLIPFVSLYLVWLKKRDLALDSKPPHGLAVIPLLAGAGALALYWLAGQAGWQPARDDYLALMMLALLSFLLAGAMLTFGAGTLRRLAFPLSFLVFAIPFPTVVLRWIVACLQHGSADAAHAFLWLAGMPLVRDGLVFGLPGFPLEVRPQCCGIHSTLVLFITSLLAGYLFLRSPVRRSVLALAVIPLALLRNGFRIFVIGELIVNVSPEMINSPIHRHGGPLFFALSLIPFFALLLLLRRSENRKKI